MVRVREAAAKTAEPAAASESTVRAWAGDARTITAADTGAGRTKDEPRTTKARARAAIAGRILWPV
ncbi:MAG: hypothetical protein L3K08_07295, partial [Thermoplasmata archaeon]|nr:hypothetical protein [Thermoplasmata archaeon]